jgi:hypothetical protein
MTYLLLASQDVFAFAPFINDYFRKAERSSLLIYLKISIGSTENWGLVREYCIATKAQNRRGNERRQSTWRETMFRIRLMCCRFFLPVIHLLLLLIISSQAQLTAETIMHKEMEWAKRSMEKHHKSRGRLPLRSPVSRAELYPRPDVDFDEDESIDQDASSSADVDLNSVTLLLLEPEKSSNNLRRRNIPDEIIQNQNRTRMESVD